MRPYKSATKYKKGRALYKDGSPMSFEPVL